ncbi:MULTISPECIES: D-sedoheptulose 7-phosphate isomerase [Spirosoma]|uniref:Phosphoheptose isomerase n=1 Tax=Spirosoma liriopis TaxID=2937440 RepID=A0ABT0HKS1_9BACT|nr:MULTISPECIES: D-sedoheptulose 7-phosphate isomerase [Spirosoma]MCK8492200.1 D-sedoheptulose 7-phosphate isomerase [Spirosoma liriopis]UHG91617.1 D-sedoheptulose 7-phosphate isomerase [Spirosoma oryzicola]
MLDIIRHELAEAQSVLDTFLSNPDHLTAIEQAARLMAESLKKGGKIISCGNGGSHCDAMHFAEELSGRYRNDRRSLAAIAISDVSHISCVSNDYGYEFVFSRFIEGLGNEGDVLLGLSTSGNSANIIRAVEAARSKGMSVILLTGKDGGKLAGKADVEIRVPHFGYADRIQEIHIKIIHLFILLIEKQVIGE